MLHAFFSQLVDEVAANILLHRFLRYGRRAPFPGPGPDRLPGLYSGDLAEFFAPVPSPIELDRDRIEIDRSALRTVWDIRFESETRTPWPENDLAWCRHWQAHSRDRGITVVGVDGIVSLGTRWFRRLADRLNPAGIDVVMVDAPCNFRRTPAGYRPGQLVAAGDMPHQLALTRQAVLDVWKVVASFQRAGRRVGLVGVSYGGWLTLLASLLAADLEFLVAVVPPIDIVGMLRHSTTIVRGIRRGIGFDRIDPAELERLSRPVVPSHWTPRLSGERIVLHAACYDRLVPYREIERLSRLWKTGYVLHHDAHYRLALAASLTARVADEVLALCGRDSEG